MFDLGPSLALGAREELRAGMVVKLIEGLYIQEQEHRAAEWLTTTGRLAIHDTTAIGGIAIPPGIPTWDLIPKGTRSDLKCEDYSYNIPLLP